MSKRYSEPKVPRTEAALVTASGMTELELLLPEVSNLAELPEIAQFLIACAMRITLIQASYNANLVAYTNGPHL